MPADPMLSPVVPEPAAEPATVRYGQRGGGCVVLADEAEWLARLQADLTARLRPADAVEAGTVEAMAVLELKLVRLDALELRVLAAGDDGGAAKLPSLATLARYRARLLKERWELEHRLRLLAASRCTNEAEAAASDAAAGRLPSAAPVASRPAGQKAETPAAPALNRRQRRKLAAMRAAA